MLTLTSEKGVVVHEEAIQLCKGLQKIPYGLIMQPDAVKSYSRKHKTGIEPADDGNTYLPKGTYALLWNNEVKTKLTIE